MNLVGCRQIHIGVRVGGRAGGLDKAVGETVVPGPSQADALLSRAVVVI